MTNACSQPGIDFVDVRMLLPKTSGNMSRKPHHCTPCADFASTPSRADIQHSAKANAIRSRPPVTAASTLVCTRNPRTYPKPSVTRIEIRYRIRELDPDLMSDEQYDAELRRLRAERDRLKALPAEPDRWDEQLTEERYSDLYQALPVSERGAWLTSHGFVIHATKKEVSVIQGDVRGTSHLG